MRQNESIMTKLGLKLDLPLATLFANPEVFSVNTLVMLAKLRRLISLGRLRKVVRFLLVLNLEVLSSFLRCIFVNLLYQDTQSQYF